MSWMQVTAEDGRFDAFLERPAGGDGPVVVVVQEIFGINEDLRATCREFAAQGFVAISPDLFWRSAPRIEMNRLDGEEMQRAFALYRSFDFDRGVRDIAAVVRAARDMTPGHRKVGVTGFCMGGLMAFLAAVRTDVDAAVSYYGGRTEEFVDEAKGVRKPVLVHLAGSDEYMPGEAQAKIRSVLEHQPGFEVHVYPSCSHAFARHNGEHYDKAAAELANRRTYAFLAKNLA